MKKPLLLAGLSLLGATTFAALAPVQAQQTSLSFGRAGNRIRRVLLISVDGMHAIDLANYVKSHPNSALSRLSNNGVTYSNATSSKPSDSFPGLLALITGGTPNSTGVYYDNSYDRNLLPPLSFNAGNNRGTNVLYDESIDINPAVLDGGGGINPNALPRDPNTNQPVYPHSFVRVNTIFEVARQAGLRTAWSDKHRAYDLVNGPSGMGVNDLYSPEVAASIAVVGGKVVDATNAPAGVKLTSIAKSTKLTEAYDDIKVRAILNEIDGKDHSGTQKVGTPALFGMNFQAVSVSQKLAVEPAAAAGSDTDPLAGKVGGYLDGQGTPGPLVQDALDHTDASLGALVNELQTKGLLNSTLVIITAKHGQSPIDPSKRVALDDGVYDTILNSVKPGLIAQKTTDDVGLLWLTDQSKTAAATAALEQNQNAIGSEQILSGEQLKLIFPDPLLDSRAPDIIVKTYLGVIYTGGSKIAEHGGFSDPDTHVALLLSNPRFGRAQFKIPVNTIQVAPTILEALGINPNRLDAVRQEGTQDLPGFLLSSSFGR